ncbi:glycosyltransferase family 4 protein [Bacteroides caecigallinarum]|uniref:glycosyltransferase family 4 protein n=1 Tax=Bacteroides caecigallinarum TaxID=1411144 RepID=UPI001F1ACA32|nr:glycosyltransferase family 4 protein [Bacteroides caecigallinarum]MCF2738410.1 glycosyltransferase family 4 protein [Bacteroides caecigallinarum]
MKSILINAYACSPDMGSEPGMAWNWCINLAKHCKLHIITEGEFRNNIEEVLPTIPQGKNMHFYYNPISEEIRKMCWNQGDWRFYKYYREWQYKTYLIAKEIIKNNHIDIVHQLNMIGFREPGYLWEIESVPFIWGPVDAKEKFPVAYLEGASLKAKTFIRLKNFITGLQLRFSPRVRKAVKRASFVISASSESQKSFKKYFNIDSPLINETGCYLSNNIKEFKDKDTFDLLWVGKLDFRKQLSLAIRTLAKLNNQNIRLHIVGGGEPSIYKSLAKDLNVSHQCIWYGTVSHNEVQRIMEDYDILFFTSVAEGTPHVVLEAIGNGLPIVCFDVCGHGDSVNDKVGIKIPLSNPEQSVDDFANAITLLEKDRTLLKQMSENCKQRQEELSWNNKALQMVELYNKILNR